jgi:flagellar protein FlgJ
MEIANPQNPKLPSTGFDPQRAVAKDLEAAFLTEMLKHAGFGKARDSFGGGAGEEHFASFLSEIQAKKMVEAGGIGLAEHIFQSIKEKQNG